MSYRPLIEVLGKKRMSQHSAIYPGILGVSGAERVAIIAAASARAAISRAAA